MTQLRRLTLCPFCNPPKWSKRLSRHVKWHHPDKLEDGAIRLASDDRLYWSGRSAVVMNKELDAMPRVMIEGRRR